MVSVENYYMKHKDKLFSSNVSWAVNGLGHFWDTFLSFKILNIIIMFNITINVIQIRFLNHLGY